MDENNYYSDIIGYNDDCCGYWGPSSTTIPVTAGQQIIFLWANYFAPGPFPFTITEGDLTCFDDSYEENDSYPWSPSPIEPGNYDMMMCSWDLDDWYSITVDNGQKLTVTYTGDDQIGAMALGIFAFDIDYNYAVAYTQNENIMSLEYSVQGNQPLELHVMVRNLGGESAEGAYNLNISLESFEQTTYSIYRTIDDNATENISNGVLSNYYSENIDLDFRYCYTVTANLAGVEGVHSNEACIPFSETINVNMIFENGNNLVSFPGILEDLNSVNLLDNGLVGDAEINFILGQGVGLFNTESGWSGNLTTISPYSGYWVNYETEGIFNREISFSNLLENCEIYGDITDGNNLVSFKWGQGNASTLDALGGEAFASENFNFILGQGLGLFNTENGWNGNLTSLIEGKGYWLNIKDGVEIDFKWGFGNCANPGGNALIKEEITIQLPEEYQFIQSTNQAFYLLNEIIIDGKHPNEGNIILAYKNDILVCSTVYNPELTILPVMGRDLSSQTVGFLEEGEVPTLKIVNSFGEIIQLEADIDGFKNLLVSEIEKVSGDANKIPTEWLLNPVYPNPFNPVTTISFGLPVDININLSIYDIEGRKMITLTDGFISAGFHTIEWNAGGLSSGIYFVKLEAGQFSNIQKLILMK